jgi:hypothetical protein
MKVIREVSSRISQGHQMLAILYKQLASADKDPAEQKAFIDAAEVQDDMAKKSLNLTLPTGFVFDEEKADGTQTGSPNPQDRKVGGSARPQGSPPAAPVQPDARPLVPGGGDPPR